MVFSFRLPWHRRILKKAYIRMQPLAREKITDFV
jgi:hypothetical protein